MVESSHAPLRIQYGRLLAADLNLRELDNTGDDSAISRGRRRGGWPRADREQCTIEYQPSEHPENPRRERASIKKAVNRPHLSTSPRNLLRA
jgi:hypothetical protein